MTVPNLGDRYKEFDYWDAHQDADDEWSEYEPL